MKKHHRAKLSFDDVKQMRKEHIAYVVGYKKLADKWLCGVSTARDICTYRTRILR